MVLSVKDFEVSLDLESFFLEIRKKPQSYEDYACYFITDLEVYKCFYQDSTVFTLKVDTRDIKVLKVRYFTRNRVTNEKVISTIELSDYLHDFNILATLMNNRTIDLCISESLHKLLRDETNFNKGDSLLNSNMLCLAKFEAVKWGNWNSWESNPLNNRTWQWALHWFEFNKGLLAYHYKTKDNRALKEIKKALSSWLNKYSYPYLGSFEFILHDHATALRAEQVLTFLSYLKGYEREWISLNFSFVMSLTSILENIGNKLYDDNFYSEYTNHGLEQVRVLMLLGVALNNKGWVHKATVRLKNELDYSFTREGVHKENSPGYHQFVLKLFLSIFQSFPEDILGDLSLEFRPIALKGIQYLTYILRPDNKLPIIGDTQLVKLTDSFKRLLDGTLEYQEFLFSVHQGKRGKKPRRVNKVYKDSGYAVFRNKWNEQKNFLNTTHIVFKAGCLSRYHSQEDENSFVLYALGEDWIIDSGLYNYNEKDDIRRYVRSQEAHNIPVVLTNKRQSLSIEERIINWKVYDYCDDDENPYVAASNNCFNDLMHDRTLKFNNLMNELEVVDSISFNDRRAESIVFKLHIPNDKEVTYNEEENYFKVLSDSKQHSMRIHLSLKPDLVSVKKGIEGGEIHSIVSHTTNQYESSQVINITFHIVNNMTLHSLLKFNETS